MNKIFLLLLTLLLTLSANSQNNSDIIYNVDTITWFGSDFSLFRLINKKKVGQEVKLEKYLEAWNTYYAAAISNVKIAKWLSVKKVFNDKTFCDNVCEKGFSHKWIVSQPYTISEKMISNHLLDYNSDHSGLGLTFIIESFYKGDPSLVHGYFVWFDIETKDVIYIYKTQGEGRSVHFNSFGLTIGKSKNMPPTTGMTGYWLNGMIDSTLGFGINFKENAPKE